MKTYTLTSEQMQAVIDAQRVLRINEPQIIDHDYQIIDDALSSIRSIPASDDKGAIETIRLIDKIAFDSGGTTEFMMNRIWHITQQALSAAGLLRVREGA